MKVTNLLKILIVLIGLLNLPGNLSAQTPHPILRYFSGIVINDHVRLGWVVNGGSTCEGIIIERSTDGVFFEIIGDIAGICGSPDTDVPYTFIDENPLPNQLNYYRLELGSQGYSNPIAVSFVPLNDSGYNLRLNSGQKSVSIFFSNPGKDVVNIGLYDVMGRSLQSNTTQESFIRIPLTTLPAGIYIFSIVSSDSRITGKFYSPK